MHFKPVFCPGLLLVLFTSRLLSQDVQYSKSVISELCSPGMHGRGYVNNGDSIAAAFIATEFAKSNISSLTKGYYQAFNIPVNTFHGRISCKIDKRQLIPGKEFILSPKSPGIDGEYKICSLTPANLSSTGKLSRWLKKSSQKVIFIDKRIIQNKPDSVKKNLDKLILSLSNMESAGPAAILVSSTEKLTWSTATSVSQRPIIYTNFLPVGRIKKTRLIIDQKFIPAYKTQNVIGMIPAKHQNDSLIVITAHYDHLGQMGRETYFPGANDNASGVALLLDLAKELSAIRDSLYYSVIFIAFSGEEAGLLGSRFFIENPAFNLHRIRFLINLDLAGTGDEGITVVNATVFTKEFSLLNQINDRRNLLPAIKSRGEACNSDHCFFYKEGVPCFFIYTMGGIKAYHDIYDRPETLLLTAYNNYFVLLKRFILALGYKPTN